MSRYRLEIVSGRKGLETFVWKFFPSLVPTAQSEWFVIYAAALGDPIDEMQVSLLKGWKEEEIILAYYIAESESEQPFGLYVTPVDAQEISGYSEEYWRQQAWKGEVPGAVKSGKQWLLPRSVVESRKKHQKHSERVEFTAIPLASRPEAKVWQVLTEQAEAGQATLLQRGETYAVQFHDEDEPTPFECLAYDQELGLYDKRKFPHVN